MPIYTKTHNSLKIDFDQDIKRSETIEALQSNWEHLLNSGYTPDSYSYNAYITTAGNLLRQDLALAKYNESLLTNHCNHFVQTAMIVTAIKVGNTALAIELYNHAVCTGDCDIVMHRAVIYNLRSSEEYRPNDAQQQLRFIARSYLNGGNNGDAFMALQLLVKQQPPQLSATSQQLARHRAAERLQAPAVLTFPLLPLPQQQPATSSATQQVVRFIHNPYDLRDNKIIVQQRNQATAVQPNPAVARISP